MSPRASHPGRRRRPRARPSPGDPPRAAPALRASPGRRRPVGTAAIPNRWRSSVRSRSASAGWAIRAHRRRSCHPGRSGARARPGTPARRRARSRRPAVDGSRAGRSTRERRRRTAADGSRGLAPPRLRGRRCSSRRSPGCGCTTPQRTRKRTVCTPPASIRSKSAGARVPWLTTPKAGLACAGPAAAMKPTAPRTDQDRQALHCRFKPRAGTRLGSANLARPHTRPRPSAGPANRAGPEDRRR